MNKVPIPPDKPSSDWSCGGWSDHQRTRFDATNGTTLLERLMWLEEASAFVRQMAKSCPVSSSAVAEDPATYVSKPADGL
ncbi:MAG: hypothetical protein WC205_17840 [Opitutaceae bacterium]|jgi:hypothetical protein